MSTASIAHHSFEQEIQTYTANRKEVSDGMYKFLRVLVVLFTCCTVSMAAAYSWELGQSLIFKCVVVATAVGIECALVFLSAVVFPRSVLFFNMCIACVLTPLLSIFMCLSFINSQQFAADNSGLEGLRNDVKTHEANLARLDIGRAEDRGTIQITNNRIREARSRLAEAEAEGAGSKATATYHFVAKTFDVPVESVFLGIRVLWAICFISLAIALDGLADTKLVSPASLKKWAEGRVASRKMMLDLAGKMDGQTTAKPTSQTARREEKEEKAEAPILHFEAPSGTDKSRFRRTDGEGEGIDENTYQKIKNAVVAKEITPSVRSVLRLSKGMDRAYAAIDRLKSEGVVAQGQNGRYQLASA
jgi:hypothetical protein